MVAPHGCYTEDMVLAHVRLSRRELRHKHREEELQQLEARMNER